MIFLNKGKEVVEITKELWRLYRREPPKTKSRIILRTAIMGYELGAVQRFAVKNAQEHLDPGVKRGLEEEAKLGLADLLTQCRLLCFDLGWDFDEIQVLGLEHLRERHRDFQRDGFAEG